MKYSEKQSVECLANETGKLQTGSIILLNGVSEVSPSGSRCFLAKTSFIFIKSELFFEAGNFYQYISYKLYLMITSY